MTRASFRYAAIFSGDHSVATKQQHGSVRGSIRYGYDRAGQLLRQTRLADNSVEAFA